MQAAARSGGRPADDGVIEWARPFVWRTAILLAGVRVNSDPNEPFDDWVTVAGGILRLRLDIVYSIWEQRCSVKRDLLPRKRRLEAMLKELDAS